MKAFTGKMFIAAVLAGAAFCSTVSLSAQTAPPPAPPAPPLPPAQQPFNILTPPAGVNPTGPAVVPGAPAPAPTVTPVPTSFNQLTAFTWDAEQKEVNSKVGDATANYTFWFTNTSPAEVIINAVRTSCGCTVAKLPATPWNIPSGTNGPIEVTIDLRGKSGAIAKAVTVESSAGTKSLICKVNIPVDAAAAGAGGFPVNHPVMGDAERLKNMQDSLKDRQVVFKDAKCATCHADPAKGQVDGSVIYRGICATCHDSPLRAAAVTDLRSLRHETDLDYWKYWITHGKEGSMMPAYAKAEGGPLDDQQINALAAFCFNTFKAAPVKAAQTPAITTNAAVTSPSVSIFPLSPAK
jgi:cytochrome c553